MADFFQTGVVSTLHRLDRNGLDRLEGELYDFRSLRRIGLVLPALYSEFETPAMKRICDELRGVEYLHRIVVMIGRCSREQYEHACTFFAGFKTNVTAIWMEEPAIVELLSLLQDADIDIGVRGKGQTCWLAFGYLLAQGDCQVIALHDCDILNYNREMLARLVYPVAHPNLGFEFCKAYYARTSNKMHGRVTRLFFTPLVRAIQELTPEIPYLRFLDSFRYALAGEFAMDADLARINRVPADWGLEVGVLAEVFRNCAMRRVCQVEIADNYDHKHQTLSAGDPEAGLRRMTRDIAQSVFRTLSEHGVVLTLDLFRSLLIFYTRFAQDTVRRYYADAVINGLEFDTHEENTAIGVFTQALRDAGRAYARDPLGAPQISNWNQVASAVPDFFDRYLQVTEGMNLQVR